MTAFLNPGNIPIEIKELKHYNLSSNGADIIFNIKPADRKKIKDIPVKNLEIVIEEKEKTITYVGCYSWVTPCPWKKDEIFLKFNDKKLMMPIYQSTQKVTPGPFLGHWLCKNCDYEVTVTKIIVEQSNETSVCYIDLIYNGYDPIKDDGYSPVGDIETEEYIFRNCSFHDGQTIYSYHASASYYRYLVEKIEYKKKPSEENLEELNKQIKEKCEEFSKVAANLKKTINKPVKIKTPEDLLVDLIDIEL